MGLINICQVSRGLMFSFPCPFSYHLCIKMWYDSQLKRLNLAGVLPEEFGDLTHLEEL